MIGLASGEPSSRFGLVMDGLHSPRQLGPVNAAVTQDRLRAEGFSDTQMKDVPIVLVSLSARPDVSSASVARSRCCA